jgi:hypothetical protein
MCSTSSSSATYSENASLIRNPPDRELRRVSRADTRRSSVRTGSVAACFPHRWRPTPSPCRAAGPPESPASRTRLRSAVIRGFRGQSCLVRATQAVGVAQPRAGANRTPSARIPAWWACSGRYGGGWCSGVGGCVTCYGATRLRHDHGRNGDQGAAHGSGGLLCPCTCARVLAIIGPGVQARSHARTVSLTRDFRESARGRTQPGEGRAARCGTRSPGLPARPAPCNAEAMRGADVVCATTHSLEPVVRRSGPTPDASDVGRLQPERPRARRRHDRRSARNDVEFREAALAPVSAGANDLTQPFPTGSSHQTMSTQRSESSWREPGRDAPPATRSRSPSRSGSPHRTPLQPRSPSLARARQELAGRSRSERGRARGRAATPADDRSSSAYTSGRPAQPTAPGPHGASAQPRSKPGVSRASDR